MNLLIPYVNLPGHHDPWFEEATYGDIGSRGRRLASLKRGDRLFFHTTVGRRKFITAYFVVDRVLSAEAASHDPWIAMKYRNPHIRDRIEKRLLESDPYDCVVFGDPVLSHLLPKPIVFDKPLATKLSLGIPFAMGRTDVQSIGSATRAWRRLTQADVRVLMRAVHRAQEGTSRHVFSRSSEEVAEVIERDIEDHLVRNPEILGKGLKLVGRQSQLATGRIDLLFEDRSKHRLLVEVKLGWIGRDAIAQIEGYLAELRIADRRPIRAAIVCAGVMPAFEADIRKKRGISVLVYGWNLSVRPL